MYFSLAVTQGFSIKGRVLTSLALMLKRKVGRIFVYDLYLLQDAILHEVRSAALLWGCTLHKPWSLGEGASKFLDAQRRRPGGAGGCPTIPPWSSKNGSTQISGVDEQFRLPKEVMSFCAMCEESRLTREKEVLRSWRRSLARCQDGQDDMLQK